MNTPLPLQQILTHVPGYVWAILATILVLGLLQSRPQRLGRPRLLVLPLAWLAFGAWGVAGAFGLASSAALAWLAGLAASVVLVRLLGWPGKIRAEGRHFLVPGSWLPLALMLGLFCAKFALGMGLALHPEWRQQLLVALGFSSLFGLLGGAILGRSLHILGHRA